MTERWTPEQRNALLDSLERDVRAVGPGFRNGTPAKLTIAELEELLRLVRIEVPLEPAQVDADEVARLKKLIDRDQTGLAHALSVILRECAASIWIAEGRGAYAWDDDRYRQETGAFIGRIRDHATEALARSGSLANIAFGNPQTRPVRTHAELETEVAALRSRPAVVDAEAMALVERIDDLGEQHAAASAATEAHYRANDGTFTSSQNKKQQRLIRLEETIAAEYEEALIDAWPTLSAALRSGRTK